MDKLAYSRIHYNFFCLLFIFLVDNAAHDELVSNIVIYFWYKLYVTMFAAMQLEFLVV